MGVNLAVVRNHPDHSSQFRSITSFVEDITEHLMQNLSLRFGYHEYVNLLDKFRLFLSSLLRADD